MRTEVVALTGEHLDRLGVTDTDLRRAYFSYGSVACCLLSDGVPVFAGGIVDLKWKRGEVWILPTPFFLSHLKTCLKTMRKVLPMIATGFVRVQASCVEGTNASIIRLFGFQYEGTMQAFGPNNEPCRMYARIFP